jgi:dihydrofolate reductase
MRQLHYCIESSLDGFIARPDHAYDFLPAAGPHQERFLESLAGYDTNLMGLKTYELGVEAGILRADGNLKHYVVSTSLQKTIDPAIEILRDDVLTAIRRLKAEPGRNILLTGGSLLASGLLAAGLIDEVRLRVIPVLIGNGIPLFSRIDGDVSLRLREHEAYANGVVLNVYRPALRGMD